MKFIKRFSCIMIAVIVMACALPLSSFATDPVSTAAMANALAQAITAYGASQGVSMTFDVADTDGIGEGVHELWDQFKEDINDSNVPTYDSFAVNVWSTLFSKVNDNVAINLDATSVSYLDAFWNWVLSGPAEMQKVDDQYYQFAINPNTNTVTPIKIHEFGTFDINGYGLQITDRIEINRYRGSANNKELWYTYVYSFSQPIYAYSTWSQPSSSSLYVVVMFDTTFTYSELAENHINNTSSYNTYLYSDFQNRINSYGNYSYMSLYSTSLEGNPLIQSEIWSPVVDLPYYYNYDVRRWTPDVVFGSASSAVIDLSESEINVQPYIGETSPDRIYIPDNEDVNYQPLPYVGELDIPWNDTLYGDGTGTLSDAQTQAIESDLSDVIEQDSTLSLAEDADIVIPSEVYIPFLPVTLPSFNFSLSGIWHYVTSWVQSLGAWFSLVFTTWSYLPAAISVPVYSTAVIVIVLGVYKRFFM